MKDELIQIRVEKELKDKLQKLADQDQRSLGGYIRLILLKITETSKKKK